MEVNTRGVVRRTNLGIESTGGYFNAIVHGIPLLHPEFKILSLWAAAKTTECTGSVPGARKVEGSFAQESLKIRVDAVQALLGSSKEA